LPTWGEILQELKAERQKVGIACFDVVRKKYLDQLSGLTGRPTILYATKWTDPSGLPPGAGAAVSITPEDVQAMMEVVHGLKGEALDLVLHSPGGSPEATEAIVSYLRSKFKDIRVFIPQAAMSAATMLACSANRIVMGRHSSIGPIDPQMGGTIPAQAILDQFELAKKECQDPKLLAAWAPMLKGYGPALLIQCRNALNLSQELVGEWLAKYMLKGTPDADTKAKAIAYWLADHTEFKTHSRHITRDEARERGLVVEDLEADGKIQDAVLSVFHAVTHTLSGTPAVKVVQNNIGRAFVKSLQVEVVQQIQFPAPNGPGSPPSGQPPA
jgi:hypothetical protein